MPTDELSIDEVVKSIAAELELELVRPRSGPITGRARNKIVRLRPIRQLFG